MYVNMYMCMYIYIIMFIVSCFDYNCVHVDFGGEIKGDIDFAGYVSFFTEATPFN